VIADILFDKAVSVMPPDDGVGQIHVLKDGLKLSAVLFGDFSGEDHCDLVGLTDGPVRVP
jgi:hypothetical protein